MRLRRGAWNFGFEEVAIRFPILSGLTLVVIGYIQSVDNLGRRMALCCTRITLTRGPGSQRHCDRAALPRWQHRSLAQCCYLKIHRQAMHLRPSVSLHLKQPERGSETKVRADSDLIC